MTERELGLPARRDDPGAGPIPVRVTRRPDGPTPARRMSPAEAVQLAARWQKVVKPVPTRLMPLPDGRLVGVIPAGPCACAPLLPTTQHLVRGVRWTVGQLHKDNNGNYVLDEGDEVIYDVRGAQTLGAAMLLNAGPDAPYEAIAKAHVLACCPSEVTAGDVSDVLPAEAK